MLGVRSCCGMLGAGYKLERGEAERLLDQVDVGHTGHVAKGQLAASQIDWGALQRDRERWLARVKRAFDEFDTDHDGVCGLEEIVACLRAKLPLTDVRLQSCCSQSSTIIPCSTCITSCMLFPHPRLQAEGLSSPGADCQDGAVVSPSEQRVAVAAG
jgi:hypothetical protein